MEKVVIKTRELCTGKEEVFTLNKSHIVFFKKVGDEYVIVMSSGDKFYGTVVEGSL